MLRHKQSLKKIKMKWECNNLYYKQLESIAINWTTSGWLKNRKKNYT